MRGGCPIIPWFRQDVPWVQQGKILPLDTSTILLGIIRSNVQFALLAGNNFNFLNTFDFQP